MEERPPLPWEFYQAAGVAIDNCKEGLVVHGLGDAASSKLTLPPSRASGRSSGLSLLAATRAPDQRPAARCRMEVVACRACGFVAHKPFDAFRHETRLLYGLSYFFTEFGRPNLAGVESQICSFGRISLCERS